MADPVVERSMSVGNLLLVAEKSVTFGEIHNIVGSVVSISWHSSEKNRLGTFGGKNERWCQGSAKVGGALIVFLLKACLGI
jgi:hypothetical protein